MKLEAQLERAEAERFDAEMSDCIGSAKKMGDAYQKIRRIKGQMEDCKLTTVDEDTRKRLKLHYTNKQAYINDERNNPRHKDQGFVIDVELTALGKPAYRFRNMDGAEYLIYHLDEITFF